MLSYMHVYQHKNKRTVYKLIIDTLKEDIRTSESEVCVKPSKYFYIRKNTKE